jgi:hypothetical protein
VNSAREGEGAAIEAVFIESGGDHLEATFSDARKMRGERPFMFNNLKAGHGLDFIIGFIESEGLPGNLRRAA